MAEIRQINQSQSHNSQNKRRLFCYSLLISFCLLTICSKSSFLYPLNDWVDVHCFFTLGRGIKHGMIPYRDLMEQKGPLLYLVFAFAALISEHSFIGVFIIEVFMFGLFLYESTQIVLEFTTESALLLLPVAGLCIVVSHAFCHGSGCEELYLFFLSYSLKTVLSQIRKAKPLSWSQSFILGLCGAVGLWTKYTFCGFYVGLAIAVIIWYIRSGYSKQLLTAITGAFAGLCFPSAIVLLIFAALGSLSALWQAYFVSNVSFYAKKAALWTTLKAICYLVSQNLSWSVLAGIAVLWLFTRFKKYPYELLAVVLSGFSLLFFTFAGDRSYAYYILILCVYAPLGIIPVSQFILRRIPPFKTRTATCIAIVTTLACMCIGLFTSQNTYLMHFRREDTPQYSFAQTINETPDATLLNYGVLDLGVYYTAGILPSNRSFCKLNLTNPEISEEQNTLVEEGRFDYVVTRDCADLPGTYYRLIQSQTFYFEGKERDYYLFKRI